MLFPAAALGIITVAVWLSSTLLGDPDAPESRAAVWTGPLLAIGGFVTMVLLIWAGTAAAERASERRKALRVHATAIARWPQYATEAQWQGVIADGARPTGGMLNAVIGSGIVATVVAVIAVWAVLAGEPSAALVLGAFVLVTAGLFIARAWNTDRELRQNQRRRQQLIPYPACWLSAEGFYDEDHGLISLDQVTAVKIIPPAEVPEIRKRLRRLAREGGGQSDLDRLDAQLARAGWSLLQVTTDLRVARTIPDRITRWLSWREFRSDPVAPITVLHVRVPPNREPEAGRVADAVTRRWLAS
jgi:hypothetical protein